MNKEIFRLLFRIFFSVAFTLVLVLIWSSTKKKSELYDMVINSSNIVKSDYVNFSDVIYVLMMNMLVVSYKKIG